MLGLVWRKAAPLPAVAAAVGMQTARALQKRHSSVHRASPRSPSARQAFDSIFFEFSFYRTFQTISF